MDYTRMNAAELASLFGAPEADVRRAAGSLLETHALDYRVLPAAERDATILEVLKVMDGGVLSASGPGRKTDWEDGWAENLHEFQESGYDPATLLPKYYNKDRPCRMKGGYARGRSGAFMYCVSDIFRRWLYAERFAGCSTVHEFGCGTGHNLLVLAELFPEAELFGYDWARSSQRILELVREKMGRKVAGRNFDFFAPEQRYDLGENAGVLTFGALEQVGNRFGPFLDALVRARPRICVHVEGYNELYDQHDLLDYLALRYHTTRNYLDGYLTTLRGLEQQGAIEILETRRARFGNLFDDPYSFVVWRSR